MRIQAVDDCTNKPLVFKHIRLVIENKDSGFLRITTDNNGYFELDDIYFNEKIGGSVTNVPGKWIIAIDDAKLPVELETSMVTALYEEEA